MESFGRKALQAADATALLECERAEDKGANFARLDALIGALLVRSLRGERIVKMVGDVLHLDSATIDGVSRDEREYLNETFSLERQQARGCWFVPETLWIGGCLANLSWYFGQFPRFAQSAAWADSGRVLLKSSPRRTLGFQISNTADAIFFWSVLEPLFEELSYPFKLRGQLAGTLQPQEHVKAWTKVKEFFGSLGFSISEEFALFDYGGGWHRLRSAAEQLEAKKRLIDALAREVNLTMGARYRARRIMPLIEQYYKKAKADGRVKRKQALTKAHQRILIGFFGGDWLSLLDYLGEEPHAEEQVATALPKTPLRVGGVSRVPEVAVKLGLSAGEVARIAATLWQQSGGGSPVEERVTLLKRYWLVFDEIHARQKPGMRPLWGLVEESDPLVFYVRNLDSPYQPRLYLDLLPAAVVAEVERLWGTVMLTKWPDSIVTELSPHRLMAETFGPALSFWQSCALTAWFLCEGPSSRTDMAGLAHHQRYPLAALREMNVPVAGHLFEELIEAEALPGPAEPISERSSTTAVGYGVSITNSLSTDSRRREFEGLRDIVTRHRRAWAEQYLDKYLRAWWEKELGDAARAFSLILGEKGGKSPTLKQFARAATLPANHWFGGNIDGLYVAIGEKCPAQPKRRRVMPEDVIAFVRTVYGELPSIEFELYNGKMSDQTTQNHYRKELAVLSLKYVQLEEALGRPPELKEIGKEFGYLGKVINSDQNQAWHIFQQAVASGKESTIG